MPAKNRRIKPCEICGNEMSIKASHFNRRKTCSKDCDKERRRVMYLGSDNPNYGNRGPLNPIFKGEVKIRKGYVYLYKPDHPMSDQDGYVREHRFVMSEYIGRNLRDDEDVHHIDENKTNNALENLQLLTRSEHTRLHNLQKKIIRDNSNGQIIGIKKEND